MWQSFRGKKGADVVHSNEVKRYYLKAPTTWVDSLHMHRQRREAVAMYDRILLLAIIILLPKSYWVEAERHRYTLYLSIRIERWIDGLTKGVYRYRGVGNNIQHLFQGRHQNALCVGTGLCVGTCFRRTSSPKDIQPSNSSKHDCYTYHFDTTHTLSIYDF